MNKKFKKGTLASSLRLDELTEALENADSIHVSGAEDCEDFAGHYEGIKKDPNQDTIYIQVRDCEDNCFDVELHEIDFESTIEDFYLEFFVFPKVFYGETPQEKASYVNLEKGTAAVYEFQDGGMIEVDSVQESIDYLKEDLGELLQEVKVIELYSEDPHVILYTDEIILFLFVNSSNEGEYSIYKKNEGKTTTFEEQIAEEHQCEYYIL